MKSNRLSQMMRNLLLMLIVLLSLSGIKTVAAQDVSFDITEADIHLQTEETAGFRFATADEIKAIADRGEFLHYDSIRKVFE